MNIPYEGVPQQGIDDAHQRTDMQALEMRKRRQVKRWPVER